MPTQFGVTAAGFVVKPLTQILSEIVADELDIIDPQLDVSPEEPVGQLNGIVSEKLAEVWELAAVAYNAMNRGDAEGPLLANIGAFGGTLPAPASPSTVLCAAAFSVAGTYAIGALVAFLPSTPTVRYSNQTAITAPSLVGGIAISTGNPFTTTAIFQSTTIGPDAGNALIAANEAAGLPFGAMTGMVPVSGWMSVSDAAGPTLGTFIETDTAYRIRQVDELDAPGACTLDSIKADILEALASAPAPVVGAAVTPYENTTLVPDGFGLPAKSYMMVVFDGLSPNTAQNDPIIGLAIWRDKPAGIQSFGNVSVTVTDSGGNPRIVFFSRTTQVPVFMTVTVAVAAAANPAAVAAAVKLAIVGASQGSPFAFFGQTVTPDDDSPTTLLPGVDVIAQAFKTVALGQAGVMDVPSLTLGLSASPVGTANLPMTRTQIGVIPAGNIAVNVQAFVP